MTTLWPACGFAWTSVVADAREMVNMRTRPWRMCHNGGCNLAHMLSLELPRERTGYCTSSKYPDRRANYFFGPGIDIFPNHMNYGNELNIQNLEVRQRVSMQEIQPG